MLMRKEQFANLNKFLRVVPNKVWMLFALMGLLYLSSYIFGYFIPIYQKMFIDTSISMHSIKNAFVYILILFYVLNYIFDILVNYCSTYLMYHYRNSLWETYYPKIINLPTSVIFKSGVGYYYSFLSSDVERVTSIFSLTSYSFVFSFVRSIAIMAIIASWDKVVFYNILVTFFVLILISLFYQRKVKIFWERIQENGAYLSKEAIESISNNFTIKNFSMLERFKNYILGIRVKNSNVSKQRSLFSTTVYSITDIVQTMGFVFILIYSISLIARNQMEYGTFVAIISYYAMIFSPIDNFYTLLDQFTSTEISIKRLNSIHDGEDASFETYQYKALPVKPLERLSINNVKFTYDTSGKEYDIDFSLTKGMKLGLVGLTGVGKSSLIKMICLDEQIQAGTITINQANIKHLPRQFYYSLMNVYSQQVDIFNKDLVYNLTLGKTIINRSEYNKFFVQHQQEISRYFNFIAKLLDNGIDDRQVMLSISRRFTKEQAYRDVFALIDVFGRNMSHQSKTLTQQGYYTKYLKSLIENQPFLLNTLSIIKMNMSYVFKQDLEEVITALDLAGLSNRTFGDRGAFISGGEKQKITFGRFLLKAGYEFFIMDEPFTNLDASTERIILDLAEQKLQDKTGLIISHKFNVLRKLSDCFIVMENGVISERGTHRELVEKEGLYKELFDSFNEQRSV